MRNPSKISNGVKILAINRQAKRDYNILETYEAGLVLTGAEVKSAKSGQINLKGAYITINQKQEAILVGTHIALYKQAFLPHYDFKRSRKLLLHKKEIQSLLGKSKQRGLTLIPLKVYIKNGLVKLEFGLARGKKKWDKRETIKKRESQRQIQRTLKNINEKHLS